MTLRPGCPIRISTDHSSVTSSLWLFAGSYVLHRLLTPRHPPCALSRLITSTGGLLTSPMPCSMKNTRIALADQSFATKRFMYEVSRGKRPTSRLVSDASIFGVCKRLSRYRLSRETPVWPTKRELPRKPTGAAITFDLRMSKSTRHQLENALMLGPPGGCRPHPSQRSGEGSTSIGI